MKRIIEVEGYRLEVQYITKLEGDRSQYLYQPYAIDRKYVSEVRVYAEVWDVANRRYWMNIFSWCYDTSPSSKGIAKSYVNLFSQLAAKE